MYPSRPKTRFPFKIDVDDPNAVYSGYRLLFYKRSYLLIIDFNKSKIKSLLCLNLLHYFSFQLSLYFRTAP